MAAAMSPSHSTPYAHPRSQTRPQHPTPSTARSTARTPAPVGQLLSPSASLSARTPAARALKEAKDQSPSYFGLSLDTGHEYQDPDEASRNISNWSVPTSNVRSAAAASPRVMPLDQNPEFEAFRRASESNTFNFASNFGSTFGSASASSQSTRSSVDVGKAASIMASPMSREQSAASAKAAADEKNTHQRSPKRLLTSPSEDLTDRPRRNSPASFEEDRHGELAQQVARFADDDREGNKSLPPNNRSYPPTLKDSGRVASFQRSETLPPSLDGEGPHDASKSDQPVIVTPQHVVGLLETADEDILLLDLRVSTQYAKSRISGALNLCIPTTLLKRPSFNVKKLAETFKDAEQRTRFERWRNSRYIIVYDASTSVMKDAATGINTLKKFASEGWTGYSYIIRGGFSDFSAKFPGWVNSGDNEGSSSSASSINIDTERPAVAPVVGGCPMPTTKSAANPFFGNIRQNMDLIGGVGQMAVKHPSSLTPRMEESLPEWVRKAADPRDNGKIVAERFLGIEKREQKRMQDALSGNVTYGTPGASIRVPRSPMMSPSGIRRRPHGGKVQIAGIEKGSKNRYNNIWPYEHSRVKIQGVPLGECDYVNANHVKASWSGRRYIATQGPIPATFVDFWNVIWQQDVRVIVMLTAEKEGGQVKAHNYWASGKHGNLHLNYLSEHRASLEPERIHGHYSKDHRDRVREQKHAQPLRRATVAANPPPLTEPRDLNGERPYVTVRRFTLSHSYKPFERMREITQLQYSNWPDFGAPAHPTHLLGLVEQCDAVIRQSAGNTAKMTLGERERAEKRPVLVHCSAGCGRTGTFCTVDSVVDILRRQRVRKEKREREERQERDQSRNARDGTPMDLDPSLSPQAQTMSSRMSIDIPSEDRGSLVNRGVASPKSTKSGTSTFDFFPPPSENPTPMPTLKKEKSIGEEEDWLEREDVDLVEKTVEEFRLQRLSMVQSLRQYVLCYESVLEWLAEQMPKTA